MSGFFMVIIDVTIVNVALPTMAKNLNVGISALQWIVAGYTLTFACLLLLAGNLSDRLGAKTAFIYGVILFAVTSLGCGMTSHLNLLIVFRLLQGVAAALLVPTSLTLISGLYEHQEERAKAIGIWASVGGVAAAAGPVFGAVLTSWFGWRAVFLVNVPVGIITFLMTLKYVEKKSDQNNNVQAGFDIFGQIAGIISIAALAFSLIEAGNFGWFSEIVIISFGIFLIAFIGFLVIEHHVPSPMFPLRFFKSKKFSAAITVGILLNVGGYGTLFILPLYFQQIRGYSVLMTGLALLPMMGIIAVAAYLGGRLTSAIGPKVPMMIGMIIGAIGFLSLLIGEEHTPSYWAFILPLAATGFGPTFTMPAATIAAMHSVPHSYVGLASGAFNASRQIGSLLGVAVFGSIINIMANFIFGMHVCLIIAATVFLSGCLVALVYVPRKELVSIPL